jgi:L-2-hydroxyglutarate oxidase LhgO
MSEKIDVTKQGAPYLLLRAITLADEDVKQKILNSANPVEVSLIVNGQSVPVLKTIESFYKSCQDMIEEEAKKIALNMVTEAGLEPIAEALRDAENLICERLQLWRDL